MGRRGGGRWGAAEDEAFLAALAVLGHVGRAASAIGWTARTAHAQRRARPDFAARWAALRRPQSPPASGHIRPARVGLGGVPARPKFVRGQAPWTEALEQDFLDHLATTCNVRASCAAVGIGSDAVYRRRRDHPDFERAWEAALAQGYARLEMGVVCAAAEAVEGRSFIERDIGPISADQAIKLIGLHRAAVRGEGKRPGAVPRPPSIEQVLETVRRRAAAIRAARPSGRGDAGPSPLAGAPGRPGSQPGLDSGGRCPPGAGLGRGGGGDSCQNTPGNERKRDGEEPELPE